MMGFDVQALAVLPLPLSFARSRKRKGYPNSNFDLGVGVRGRGRYPLRPRIFASLLETKGYPAAMVGLPSECPINVSFFSLHD